MLFTSGRPVIVIPPYWERGVEFGKIMVAWDGRSGGSGNRGSYALPTCAQQIDILCVSPDASKRIAGADLAAQLSRHSKKVTVTELQTEHRDVAKKLRDHATMARASLLVMGAFPHLLRMVLGGVTSDMPTEAELPVLLSY
jgi:nucleotide-binding universal stress UspA family protein